MTTYILILTIGPWSTPATTTAEFNNLQTCQAAIAQAQETWMYTNVEGICVTK